jgi:AcrR family transcriptional regulator
VQTDDRASRIVDTAIELAAQGGFENVRLRDVAANAGVALGTLYRHFRSKEDLLVAALSREIGALEERFKNAPPTGEGALERLEGYFRLATRTLCRKPKFARAVLRAVSSGDRMLAKKVNLFHDRTTALIVRALRGEGASEPDAPPATEGERDVAEVLQNVWFSSLVGWSGGLRSQPEVVAAVTKTAQLVLGSGGPE